MSKTDPEEVKLYKEDLIAAFQKLKETFMRAEEFFAWACRDRTRDNGLLTERG